MPSEVAHHTTNFNHPHYHHLIHNSSMPMPVSNFTWHDMYMTMPIVWILFAVAFSMVMASFYGVLVYRLPAIFKITYTEYARTKTDTTIMGRSHCDHCDRTLNFVDLIPVLGWIIRRGKCPDCGAKVPVVYPIIEGLAGLVGGFLMWVTGGQVVVPIIASWFLFIIWLDDRCQWLPEGLFVPVLLAAFLLPLTGLSPVSLEEAVIGFLAGYALLTFVFGVMSLVLKQDIMNTSDIWLFGAMLALCGWQAIAIFAGGIALLSFAYMVFIKVRSKYTGEDIEMVNGQQDSKGMSELEDEEDGENWSIGLPMAPPMCLCGIIIITMEFTAGHAFHLPF